MHAKDFEARRKDFPSLERTFQGFPLAYFDGPGGTQMPRSVMETMVDYLSRSNANEHGFFVTTNETDAMVRNARETLAAFLGAPGPENISFGANMTTLNYALSRAIGKHLQPGDEILITQLDHEANRGPWLALRDEGMIVREIALKRDCTLDYEDFEAKVNENTRLVALGCSSNVTGTVNDIPRARELTYRVGAWLLVDAVHYAPHFPLDVTAWGVDFLLCSAYKFYGPHVGVLYAREGLLDRLPAFRLRTTHQHAPYCIETGTPNTEGIAGTTAAVHYIASFGSGETLRERIVSGMETIFEYEHELAKTVYEKLREMPGITIVGPSFDTLRRTPTISFTAEGKDPVEICKKLGNKGICAWDGHFYGIRPIEILGLLEKGGVTRIGISLYNTAEEVNRLLEAVKGLI